MPFSDTRKVNALFALTLTSLMAIVALFSYEVGRWRDFDAIVKVNAVNIKGVQDAVMKLGVLPASVPNPRPVATPGPPRVLNGDTPKESPTSGDHP